MTGFGHARSSRGGVALEIEVKTVNHRFLDLSFKLPRAYSSFEGDVRALLQAGLQRGRVEVYISRTLAPQSADAVKSDKAKSGSGKSDARQAAGGARVVCNQALLVELYRVQVESLQQLGLLQGLSQAQETELRTRIATDLFRRQDVLEVPDEIADVSAERGLLLETLSAAISQVTSMQDREGAHLRQDLEGRLATLERLRGQIESRAQEFHANLRARMIERVHKLAPEVVLDEARLASEVVVAADRSDITEELVRLGSHLAQFHSALTKEPSGKRFDFLLQEIHREFNTIGSKAQDAALQRSMLEAKMEIEKIREQVQNIA